MKKNKRTSTIEVEDGVEVYQIEDSMSSIEEIKEEIPIVNIHDYLSKFHVKNLVNKK
jgi:hypothetical protein